MLCDCCCPRCLLGSLTFDYFWQPSPGKPRIPGGAILEYEVFFEVYPGMEDDLLEVNDEQK